MVTLGWAPWEDRGGHSGVKFSLWGNANVLKFDYGDSYTTL